MKSLSLHQDGDCRYNPANIGATCTGYVDVKEGDEDALQEAVATIGPVSVAIDASHVSFQLYESGKLFSNFIWKDTWKSVSRKRQKSKKVFYCPVWSACLHFQESTMNLNAAAQSWTMASWLWVTTVKADTTSGWSRTG